MSVISIHFFFRLCPETFFPINKYIPYLKLQLGVKPFYERAFNEYVVHKEIRTHEGQDIMYSCAENILWGGISKTTFNLARLYKRHFIIAQNIDQKAEEPRSGDRQPQNVPCADHHA